MYEQNSVKEKIANRNTNILIKTKKFIISVKEMRPEPPNNSPLQAPNFTWVSNISWYD